MANEVVINVTANVAKAKAGLAGIADKMKSVGRAATVAGGGITAIGVGSITQFAKMGDEVQKMALRTGFSTEALSELRVAADLSGSSLKGMETGIRRMSKVIIDAKDGLAESKDALDRMGVSVDDLMGKSPEQQFEILSMALAGMTDKTAQAATAQEVFGRAGTALLPMLAGGAAGLEEMKQKAHEMGVVFDQEAADKAARLSDSFTTLKGSLQGVMLAIAEQLAPVITDVAEKMGTAISKISAWTDANPGLTQVIILVSAAVGGLLLVLGPLLVMLPGLIALAPAVGAAFTIMMGPVGLIVLAIAALVAGVIGLAVAWNKNLGGIREKTAAVFGFIKDLYESKLGWILPGGALIKALIMLKDNWGAIWGGMKDFVATTWNAIRDTFKAVFESLPSILKGVINTVIGLLNSLIQSWNDLSFSIPPVKAFGKTIFPGVTVSTPNVPTIPLLDRGGIVQGPGIFAVGPGVREVVRAPTADPLGIKAAYFASGRTVLPGNYTGPGQDSSGLPAGLMGQGNLSIGLQALMSGQDPAEAVRQARISLDGKDISDSTGTHWEYDEDLWAGG